MSTESVDLRTLGAPVPASWQVQLVRDAEGRMLVKQVILTPIGIVVVHWDGEQAQHLASKLREGGRAAVAGVWAAERPGGPTKPVSAVAPPEAFSPAEGAESG